MLSHSLRRFAGTALASLALATAACGGDDGGSTGPEPVPADVSGTYELTGLRTLGNLNGGGNGLPVVHRRQRVHARVPERLPDLEADGTYYLEVEAEFNGGGVVMDDEGTWELSGNAIDFTPLGDPARMEDGTISGGSITADTQFGGIPFQIDLEK